MSTTKRPKKPASGGSRASSATPSKTTRKKKPPAATPPPQAARDDEEGDDDDDDEDDAPAAAAKPGAAAVAQKPKPSPAKKSGLPEIDAPAVVPARRLTPEARAKLNEMLAKGVNLQDALRKVAQWETFIAPVREPVAPVPHHGPGPKPDGAPRHQKPVHDDDEPAEADAGGDDEPVDVTSDE